MSKILVLLTVPSIVVLLISLTGVALLITRFERLGRSLLVIGSLLYAIIGISPLGYVLMLPLEERFTQWDSSLGAPTGLIVLGGMINPYLSLARGEVALSDAAERVTAAVALARRYPGARVVFSGGSARPGGPSEAASAQTLFESLGISRDRILLETSSRNTAENAIFTKELLNPKPGERWLLVTSAAHMPRAMGVFRKADFLVEAYPVDWQTTGRSDLFSMFGTPADGLRLFDAAVHEWVGLLAYWISGQTSEFFPGPNAAGSAT